MNLIIFFYLLVPLSLQDGDQQLAHVHHPGVHHQCFDHLGIEFNAGFDLENPKLLDMFSEILGRDVDPKEPLNSIDLAKLIMNDSSNKVKNLKENLEEKLEFEREHNKKVINAVVTGFCNRLKIIEDSITKCETNLTQTKEDLYNNFYQKAKTFDNAEEKVSEVELKLETYFEYQQQLLFNLKLGLQDSLCRIDNDIKFVTSQINSCNVCGCRFESPENLRAHMQTYHSLPSNVSCLTTGDHLFQGGHGGQYSLHENVSYPAVNYDCNSCGETFVNPSEVETHVCQYTHNFIAEQYPDQLQTLPTNHPQTRNEPSFMLNCDLCHLSFKSSASLSSHVQYVHGNPDPVHCKFCDKSFGSIVTLNQHTFEKHTRYHGTGNATEESSVLETSPHCEKMLHSLGTNTPQRSTSSSQSSPSSVSSDVDLNTCIGQLDGNDSIDDIDDHENTRVEKVDAQAINPSYGSSERLANFVLNRKKQVDRIGADTEIPDFDITINNENQNVSILCSTGFYDTVAKPVMCGLVKGSSITIQNVSIECHHIDLNRDRTLCEYNRVLHITLGGTGKFNPGKVTVHLHHTRRHIQLQGSATMPDGTRSPVWFLNYYLKEKFSSLAKLRKFDIADFNKAVNSMVTKMRKSSNNCGHCMRQFTTSSRPTSCMHCGQVFHKTNCLSSHTTVCARKNKYQQQAPMSLSPPSIASHQISPVTTSDSSITTTASIMSLTTSLPPSASLEGQNSDSRKRPRLDNDRLSTPTTVPDLSLSSSTTNTSSSLSSSAPPWAPTSQASQARNNPKKTRPGKCNVSPENAKIDYLNLELNSAKTRIAQLETKITDYEATIKIQEDKLKVMESQRHDIILNSMNKPTQEHQHTKNTHQPCQATTACHPSHSCPSAWPHCAPRPPCPCPYHQPYQECFHTRKGQGQVSASCHSELPHDRKNADVGDIKGIEASINRISAEIVDIVCNITEIQDWQNKFSQTESDKTDVGPEKSTVERVSIPVNLNEKADTSVIVADIHYNKNEATDTDVNEIVIDDSYTPDIIRNNEEKEPTANINDDSVVSIDDFVPDIHSPANNLNYQSKTSQQLLLMLN